CAGLGFFGIRPVVAVGVGLVAVVGAITTGRYWTWERITLGLAIFNGLFIPAAILAHPNWPAVGHALLTWTPLPQGRAAEILLLILADIGATVTPWMIFFQQSAVVDKGMQPRDIRAGRFDTLLGATLAAIFAIAAILATAPLFHHGIDASQFQGAQFAEALAPWIGHVGAALFALGIFEAGIVAAIAISTSSAYAFGEVIGTGHSLNRPVRDAWPFYSTLLGSACAAAALVLIPHAPLEFVVLTVNVIAVLAMPPALAFLILLVNDRDVMGEHVNGFWANSAGIAVTVLLVFVGIAFGVTTVFPKLLGGENCAVNRWVFTNCDSQSPRDIPVTPKDSESKRDTDSRDARSEPVVVAKPDLEDPHVVLSLLETDQVVAAKQKTRFGPRKLSVGVRVLLWGLRIYVLAMLVLVVVSVIRAIHSGH